MRCTATVHDTLAAYKRGGCRCPKARAENAIAMKAYRLRLLTGWVGIVDGTGTRRRIQALVANGWPLQLLADRLGVSKAALSELANSERRVHWTTAGRVQTLYQLLADVEGPSRSALIRARKRGWLPPLWWDDDTIDDLTHAPPTSCHTTADDVDQVVVDRLVAGVRVHNPTVAERLQAIAILRGRGLSPTAIADRLAVSGARLAQLEALTDADGITEEAAA